MKVAMNLELTSILTPIFPPPLAPHWSNWFLCALGCLNKSVGHFFPWEIGSGKIKEVYFLLNWMPCIYMPCIFPQGLMIIFLALIFSAVVDFKAPVVTQRQLFTHSAQDILKECSLLGSGTIENTGDQIHLSQFYCLESICFLSLGWISFFFFFLEDLNKH